MMRHTVEDVAHLFAADLDWLLCYYWSSGMLNILVQVSFKLALNSRRSTLSRLHHVARDHVGARVLILLCEQVWRRDLGRKHNLWLRHILELVHVAIYRHPCVLRILESVDNKVHGAQLLLINNLTR